MFFETRLSRLWYRKIIGTILEEIVAQRLADFEHQRHGDPLLVEDLIDVLGRAVHLPRKPCGRAALPLQLGLDKSAQMEIGGGKSVAHIVSN